MSEKQEHSVLEALLESSEVAIDIATSNDVVAEIPVVGTAFRVLKAFDAMKDKALAAKLLLFVRELGSFSEEQKERYKAYLHDRSKNAKKVGETLFLVLNNLTDLEKPSILAAIFIAYLDQVVTDSELRRLAQAIDASFFDDLKTFLSQEELPSKSQLSWMQSLSSSGLTCVVGGDRIDDVGKIYYDPTALGTQFRKAYFHGQKKKAAPAN